MSQSYTLLSSGLPASEGSAAPAFAADALWKAAIFSEAIHTRWLRGERPGDTGFGAAMEHGVPQLLDVAERLATRLERLSTAAHQALSRLRNRPHARDLRQVAAELLHDVIGHSVSVMTVQASAVRRRLTPAPACA